MQYDWNICNQSVATWLQDLLLSLFISLLVKIRREYPYTGGGSCYWHCWAPQLQDTEPTYFFVIHPKISFKVKRKPNQIFIFFNTKWIFSFSKIENLKIKKEYVYSWTSISRISPPLNHSTSELCLQQATPTHDPSKLTPTLQSIRQSEPTPSGGVRGRSSSRRYFNPPCP